MSIFSYLYDYSFLLDVCSLFTLMHNSVLIMYVHAYSLGIKAHEFPFIIIHAFSHVRLCVACTIVHLFVTTSFTITIGHNLGTLLSFHIHEQPCILLHRLSSCIILCFTNKCTSSSYDCLLVLVSLLWSVNNYTCLVQVGSPTYNLSF